MFEEYLEEVGHHLVVTGVLVRKKKRLFLALQDGESPQGEDTIKNRLKSHVREIVLDGKEPELPELVLLAFLYHADLFKLVFGRSDRKKARKRIIKLIFDEDEASRLGATLDIIVTMACK